MICWICGSDGNSGEHLVKASDIKSVFKNISQNTPLVYRRSDTLKRKIGSRKANILKSNALICTDCNNKRTSDHDRAWETLSEYLRQYPLEKRGPLRIRLSKVFKQNRFQNVLAAHLYFVKLFGCRIIEESIPIDIKPPVSSGSNKYPESLVSFDIKTLFFPFLLEDKR